MDYIKEIRTLVGSRPVIFPGVALLIFNKQNDKLLLQKRVDNGLWGLTGGFMEPGESFEDTAYRECFEEIGIKPESLSFLSLFSGADLYYKYPNGDEVYSVIAVFSTTVENEAFQLDLEEVSEVHYFPVEKLPEHINPNHKTVLKKLGYC